MKHIPYYDPRYTDKVPPCCSSNPVKYKFRKYDSVESALYDFCGNTKGCTMCPLYKAQEPCSKGYIPCWRALYLANVQGKEEEYNDIVRAVAENIPSIKFINNLSHVSRIIYFLEGQIYLFLRKIF